MQSGAKTMHEELSQKLACLFKSISSTYVPSTALFSRGALVVLRQEGLSCINVRPYKSFRIGGWSLRQWHHHIACSMVPYTILCPRQHHCFKKHNQNQIWTKERWCKHHFTATGFYCFAQLRIERSAEACYQPKWIMSMWTNGHSRCTSSTVHSHCPKNYAHDAGSGRSHDAVSQPDNTRELR